MPLPGGSSDKIGNRHELWWTAACLVELLDEGADSISIEPPGDLGDGVEFILIRNGSREFHQVKRQVSRGEGWTISLLKSNGVLDQIAKKLKDALSEYHFVSTIGTRVMDEFAQNSRQSENFLDFKSIFLASRQRLNDWSELIKAWESLNEQGCYEYLKRVHIDTIAEDLLRNQVKAHLGSLVEGDPRSIANELVVFALDSVNCTITQHSLWHHLESKNLRRRSWGKDPHVLAAVEKQNDRFRDSHRNEFFLDHLLKRPISTEIFDGLRKDVTERILVSGEAGGGKSCVLFELIEALSADSIPYLAIRLDRFESATTTTILGGQVNLPGSPVPILGAISKNAPCVLIIDQLDAVSLISGKNPDLFDTVNDLFQESVAFPQMRIVATCRGFDLENDYRLKRVISNQRFTHKILEPLAEADVRAVVAQFGFDPNLTTEHSSYYRTLCTSAC